MRVNIVVWNHIVYRIEPHESMYMVDAIMKEFFDLQYIARLITACVQQLRFDYYMPMLCSINVSLFILLTFELFAAIFAAATLQHFILHQCTMKC